MVPTGLRVFLRTTFVLATVAVVSASCSRQAEGERCDYDWAGATQDCNSGLQCTPCGNLQTSVVDRCCRVDGTYTDPRCAPAAAPSQLSCSVHGMTEVGSAGKSGSAGAGTAGSGTAGSATSGGSSGAGGSGASAGSSSLGNAGEATAGTGG